MAKGTSSFSPRKARWLVSCLLASMLVDSWAMRVHGGQDIAQDVLRECSFTRYPTSCKETLLARQGLGLGLGHSHADLVSSLVEKTIDETKPHSFGTNLQVDGMESQEVIGYCDELMQMSLRRLNQTLTALRSSPSQSKPDIQTWLSAVLTFHDSCRDSATATLPATLASHISGQTDHLSVLASNALALANRIPSSDFPTWVSPKHRKLLQISNGYIQADAVVAQDGTGDYTTVSEAVEAGGGGGRYVIYVKAGVYKDKVNVNKDNVMLVGDGKDSTIITHGSSVGGGSTMKGSATVVVTGDGFMAWDIGFENAAGPGGEQALALRIASDYAVLYRCSLRGYQDTLYAHSLRQFYRECDIYGTIDFIFGNAAAVFQACNLILRRPSGGSYNTILANGRSDPGQNTGFVVQSCSIGAGSELYAARKSVRSFLGRPWKQYSRAVVMESSIDDSLQPQGWVQWSGGFALNTLYFAEYLNGGPGADTSGRVQWPGFHVIGEGEAEKFTVGNFISGNSWLPSTGVRFDAGL